MMVWCIKQWAENMGMWACGHVAWKCGVRGCGDVGMWAGGSSSKALSAVMPTVRPWSELPRMLLYPIIRLLASFCSATKLCARKRSVFKHGAPTTGRLSSLLMPQLSMTVPGFHGAAIIDRCLAIGCIGTCNSRRTSISAGLFITHKSYTIFDSPFDAT
jgi:hypothetical protein